MKRLLLMAMVLGASACGPSAAAVDTGWKTTAGEQDDWRDEVIYQLMVDRFANGDQSNDVNVVPGVLGLYQGGDWEGVIQHIDYLKKLGVTTVWISPVLRNLESDSGFDSYHGYWQQDFEHVNPHFGDLAKLREMTQKLHAAGLKVILDIVANHVAQLFYYDINGNGSPDDDVYGAGCGEEPPMNTQPCPSPAIITHVNEYDPDYDPLGVRGYTSLGFSGPAQIRWVHDPAIDREPTLPGANADRFDDPGLQTLFNRQDWYHRKGRITDYGQRDQVLTGDFPGGLKDLATERPDVTAALTAMFARWVQAGDFDGFRIDTLKHVDHPFWQSFCPSLRQYTAGAGELSDPTIHPVPASVASPVPVPPNDIVPPLSVPKKKFLMFGESFDGSDQLDGSYTMNDEVDSVVYFAQKFNVFDNVFKYNGPTTAIEAQFMAKQVNYGAQPATGGIGVAPQDALINFLDNHDVPRFLFDKPSVPALHNALGYLLTEDGIPCLYYGTEQEFNGGNDPTNREDLWETGYNTTGDTFKWIQLLIAVRKAYEPLRRGDLEIKWSTTRVAAEEDAGIFAFERSDATGRVLVVVNTSDTKTSETSAAQLGGGPMVTGFAQGTSLTDILAPAGDPAALVTVGAAGALTVQVPARGVRVLVPTSAVVPIVLPQ